MPISVNVSAQEFRQKGFVAGVREILEDTRLDPRYLELELTEGVLMADPQSSVPLLCELKNIGVRIALTISARVIPV